MKKRTLHPFTFFGQRHTAHHRAYFFNAEGATDGGFGGAGVEVFKGLSEKGK